LAIGEKDPVMLAYTAHDESSGINGGRLAGATLSAIAALLRDATTTALVCVGKLDPEEDYRRVFSFAARHKLSILFLVANTLTPRRRQPLDLSSLDADFGIPVFSVAANDAIAAYRVATEALHNARHLRGPCVIEALTVNGKRQSAVSALDLLRNYMERHGNWPL
jgi:TPP-dependent pyruvate/acetoin dehydrogenase alpha subunit